MATKYLGERFDIHTGGVDHVRIHHTNEVAQSECVLDVHPWVSTWMHNEFLDLGGEKISKSAGHVLVVDTLVERGIDPLAFRYFFLQAHYRQQQAFTWEAMEAAATTYRRLVRLRGRGPRRGRRPGRAPRRAAPPALLVGAGRRPQRPAGARGRLGCGARHRPHARRSVGVPRRRRPRPRLRARRGGRLPTPTRAAPTPASTRSVAERQAAREAKDFATSDRIRDELAAEGIELVDTPTGTTWRRR